MIEIKKDQINVKKKIRLGNEETKTTTVIEKEKVIQKQNCERLSAKRSNMNCL